MLGFFFKENHQKQWSLYDTNPNFMHCYVRKIPQNQICMTFDSPKMGNDSGPLKKNYPGKRPQTV